MGAAGPSPVEGEGQHPDVLVGGQAEEDAPQAGICNPRGQCHQGPLMCLWEPGRWTPHMTAQWHPQHLATFSGCLNELVLHLS